MPFVETINGNWVNLDRVCGIGPGRIPRDGIDRRERFALYGEEGDNLGETVTDPATLDAPTVPAAPGTLVLHPWIGDDAEDVDFADAWPVVAWRLGAWGPVPVCASADASIGLDGSVLAVEFPDGRVVDPFSGLFDDRVQWLKQKRVEAKQAAERRAAADRVALAEVSK